LWMQVRRLKPRRFDKHELGSSQRSLALPAGGH
jgi:hypothetical protein